MSENRFQGTDRYVATDDLRIAVNASITLERPLLIKGEPGTGKTQLAYEVSDALGAPLITWHVKSTTKAQQGLYEYDAVTRLRDSQLGDARVKDVKNYIKQGKLWEAFVMGERPVLLIDEIDKADIEFPNDLLLELDRMEFFVYETGETIKAVQRPIILITSNNEKELPDAFLRRCFFHYIKFPERDTMQKIIDVHYPGIKQKLVSRGAEHLLSDSRRARSEEEAIDQRTARLAEAPDERRRAARGAAREGPDQADPAAARRAAQERAGRALVRTTGIFGAKREQELVLKLSSRPSVARAGTKRDAARWVPARRDAGASLGRDDKFLAAQIMT